MDLNEFKNQGGKVFLYYPKYPNSEAATVRIIKEWQKKTFGIQGMMLVFCLDQSIDWYRYALGWVYHCLSSCAPIIYITKRYTNFNNLLACADYYIIDNLEADLDDINIVCNNGGMIIPAHSNEEVFPMLEYTEAQSNSFKQYSQAIHNDLISKYPLDQYEYMLFHNGLGETVAFYYSMMEYKKKNKKPIVVLCFDASRKSLLEESPYIDVVAQIPFILYEYIAVFLAEKYSMKNFMEIFYRPDVVSAMGNIDCRFSFLQAVRNYMGILNDGPVQKYKTIVSKSKLDLARDVFKKWNLRRGKTVWLCMDSLSNGSVLNTEFMKELVIAIKERDYDVIIKSDKSVIDGVPYVILHPWETTELVSLCGNVIGVPTGIICAIQAMNMDRPLNIQWIIFEEILGNNSDVARYMHYYPMMRKYGSNYLNYVREHDEDLLGKNVNKIRIPVRKNADLNVLISKLVEGLA